MKSKHDDVKPESGKKLLNVSDLQNELNLSRDRAYKLMHSTKFPSIQIGKQYFVSAARLDEWLSSSDPARY